MSKKFTVVGNFLLACLLTFASVAFSAFDPVFDDTDLFRANPNIPAERPNVLIVLDNTANWNTPFVNEKNALVQVVNNLNDNFNVGLMMMVETGGGNDNVDGAYVRYHVRRMTDGTGGTPNNKGALASIVNNLDILGDKSNNNMAGFALHEAYLYYAGRASRASYGKLKVDKDGTTDPILSALPGPHALEPAPTAASLYRSPIVDGCQKNFVIYISNGPANENASARSELEGYLGTLTGTSPPAVIGLAPADTGQQVNWADEMAKHMANADVNTNITGVQNVYTYVVEVNPGATGQGPAMSALLNSVAANGKGKYFPVTDNASGTAIVDALNAIFSEIQAVNSVFAAATLPVSINVRGTNSNQVYLGVFRPDATDLPRWYGNLKLYQFGTSSAGSILIDAVGAPLVNSGTGFVTGGAQSFWTTASNFWSFRTTFEENGVGGASDLPDGDKVEKGGVAQQIRLAYATDQSARRLFTCTPAGNLAACVTGSLLSATPFVETNTAITSNAFNLAVRLISPLTAFQTKTVSNLTDRKDATLNNLGTSFPVTLLFNNATTRSITDLRTSTAKIVTTLSASVAGAQTRTITSITKSGSIWTVQAAGPLPSGYTNGTIVTFSGFANTSWNGVALAMSSIDTAANTFRVNPAGNPGDAATGGSSVSATIDSTTAVATLSGHGYSDGQQVTIAGATPAQFNGTFAITLGDTGGLDTANKFRYSMASAGGTAAGSPTITAAGNTLTATATSAAHGFLNATTVTISGASIAGYNGAKTITTSANSFTYTVSPALAPNTTFPVYAVQGGTNTVTATAPGHTFINGQTINIAGSDISGYNGSFLISGVVAGTSFQFDAGAVYPANNSATVSASASTSTTVTVTSTNHGFANNDFVFIDAKNVAPGPDTFHPGGPFQITFVDNNTFTYTSTATSVPVGSFTVRPQTPKAYATVTAHGYGAAGATKEVVIQGAVPGAYNVTATATVIDANTITYPIASAPGPNTSGSVTSSVKTTTARATSVAHGFNPGDSIAIANATPIDFNGTWTVLGPLPDVNTFEFTLLTPQGAATGAITATSGAASSAERTALIRWVRGEDNKQDENINTVSTDIRASVHGDVLHSRPAVVNYNRYGTENDVYIYYGANDGIFRAVKGGTATDAGATGQPQPGQEAWGFIPTEFFGQLNRLRLNAPAISSSFKKPYFADGPISVYTKDTDNNKRLGDATDKANLYIGMRRGGRLLYALDVNNPLEPSFLWKIDNTSTGFAELGQTWGEAAVVPPPTSPSSFLIGQTGPVLIFGGGYDPLVEDLDPGAITAMTATSVTTAAGVTNRTMGRGIFVVNALTGAKLLSIGRTGSGADIEVSGMDYAIPANVIVVRNESGAGAIQRAYAADTGGNIWRIDFRNPLSNTLVTKIASIADQSTVAGRRKFIQSLDVVYSETGGGAQILAGTGDREHPFDATVANRFYMFLDQGTDAGPLTGTGVAGSGVNETLKEIDLFNATSNCLQVASACAADGFATQADARTDFNSKSGWYIRLRPGEKTTGSPLAQFGTVSFSTNEPSATAGGGTCGANLGINHIYTVGVADATAVIDRNGDGTLDASDRDKDNLYGGFGTDTTGPQLAGAPPGALVGLETEKITGPSIGARLRKYWFKEVD